MSAFEKFLGNNYDFLETIKSDEKNFVARIFDKSAKKLCVLKYRNANSHELYKILKSLNNSHIPQIFRLFEYDNKLIVIEEHIDGQTLDELLNYNIKNFDERLTENILLQICECLKIVHEKNIIHRDLTLSNIMLTKNNFVMITDFGIARIYDSEKITDTEFLGTKGYAAPEQYGLFDLEQSDFRTDIFNLGMSMKKLLGENYHGYLEKILNRCTNLNPDARYQNISDLIRDISRHKKFFRIKKFAQIPIITIGIFLITQINFEEKKISPPTPPEKITEPTAEKKILPVEKKSVEKFEFPEIIIPQENSTPTNIELPKISETTPEIKKSDRVKILFYLNGVLTENYGKVSGNIFINDYQNWSRIKTRKYGGEYYLFPANYTARIVIENFTAKDLITPRITVTICDEEIIFDKPAIKSGEVLNLEIPVANKPALKILGEDNIHGKITIQIKSSSHENIVLIRYLEIQNI